MAKISVLRGSVVYADTDAIVNAANAQLAGGSGVCGAIFEEAGWGDMQQACDRIGGCPTGEAVSTPGFKLKAKYVIHAVGPHLRRQTARCRALAQRIPQLPGGGRKARVAQHRALLH